MHNNILIFFIETNINLTHNDSPEDFLDLLEIPVKVSDYTDIFTGLILLIILGLIVVGTRFSLFAKISLRNVFNKAIVATTTGAVVFLIKRYLELNLDGIWDYLYLYSPAFLVAFFIVELTNDAYMPMGTGSPKPNTAESASQCLTSGSKAESSSRGENRGLRPASAEVIAAVQEKTQLNMAHSRPYDHRWTNLLNADFLSEQFPLIFNHPRTKELFVRTDKFNVLNKITGLIARDLSQVEAFKLVNKGPVGEVVLQSHYRSLGSSIPNNVTSDTGNSTNT